MDSASRTETPQPTRRPSAEPPALRRATVEDLPQLTRVLAAAFFDDPAFVWLMPDERKRPAQLRRFFDVELRHVGFARGVVWTTEDFSGAAISTPPGRWQVPWRTQLRLGPAYWRAFRARLPHATWLLGRIESRHPRRPHHYFAAIGVAPDRQGRGVGTGLMQPTLDTCHKAHLPAYLEASSARNARLYERLGFQLVDELHYGAGEPLRLMLRPAPAPAA